MQKVVLIFVSALLILSCRKMELPHTDRTRGLVEELLVKLDSTDVYAAKKEKEIEERERLEKERTEKRKKSGQRAELRIQAEKKREEQIAKTGYEHISYNEGVYELKSKEINIKKT